MMNIQRLSLTLCLLMALELWGKNGALASENPVVVASLPPFYALTKAVMAGVGEPKLLVKPSASPHHYILKPSELQMLNSADVLFWGGPHLESFLIKPLASHAKKNKIVIQFDETPKLILLNRRENEVFEAGCCQEGHNHSASSLDMHFWLEPTNAKLMIDSIVAALSKVDPKQGEHYKKNGERLKARLTILDKEIAKRLASVKSKPFIVFHDAYQYFERHYGLKNVGSITINPEVPPSTRKLVDIKEIIKNRHAVAVFSEPQFSSKLVDKLIKGTKARKGLLDPLGYQVDVGTKSYEALLEDLSLSFSQSLSDDFANTNNPKPIP